MTGEPASRLARADIMWRVSVVEISLLKGLVGTARMVAPAVPQKGELECDR